jgi:phospholipid/cholesterol/gamma-HCH transport system substrate-binding protein
MVSRLFRFRVLILLILVAVVGGTVAATQGLSGYTLKLDFTNADGLVQGNDVTIAGVKVGKVEDLSLRDNVAVVTASVEQSTYAPLKAGTKGIIRSLGLLGNHYLEIVPGIGPGQLDSGKEVGIDSTTSPTDLDQINAIFDAPTRDKIRAMTLQGQIALGGRAQTLNKDLAQLRNLALAAEPVTGVLDAHQVSLDRATVAFDTLTQKLVREDASLRGLVEHGSSVLSAIQAHDAQLAGLLAHGDASFSRLDQILAGNENNLAGFLARQPTVIRSSDYSLTAGIPVLRAVQPLIRPLDELLYDMADATTGINGTADPNAPPYSSSAIWALRPLAVVCSTIVNSADSTVHQC